MRPYTLIQWILLLCVLNGAATFAQVVNPQIIPTTTSPGGNACSGFPPLQYVTNVNPPTLWGCNSSSNTYVQLNTGSSGTGNPGGSLNSVQINGGASTFAGVGPGTNGQIIVGQSGVAPLFKTVSGDGTLAASGALTVTASGGVAFGTAAFVNTGTSGGTLGLLNANLTFGGTDTFTLAPTITALAGGGQLCVHATNAGVLGVAAADCGTGGGSPAFNTITSGTNTTAAMIVGTGGSLATSGSGTIAATSAPLAGISGLGTGVATALGLAVSGTGNICLTSGSACGGGGSLAWQIAGSTFSTNPTTVNFATGFLGTNPGGVATLNPDTGLLLTNGNDQANHCKFVDSTNGTTSYTGSLATGCIALTSGNLVAGSTFLLRTNADCPGSCNLQIDGVPAVAASITQADGTTAPTGAIKSGQFNWVMYDGTVFRLLPGGTGGSGPTLQTNGVNNTTQTALNFQTSTTNSVGLTITPSNPSTSNEKMEITGTYTGSGVYNTVQTTGPGGAQPAPTNQTSQTKANFTFPLKASNDAGNSSTDVSVVGPCDPRKMMCFYDDFVNAGFHGQELVSGGGDYFVQQFGGSTAAVDNPSATGTYGSVTIATGTTASAIGTLGSYSGASQSNYAATTFDYLVRFKLSATAQARMFLGFKDTSNNFFVNATDYIAIVFDATVPDTNFMCVAKTGGLTTRTSTGFAADTSLHTARIRATTAGTILCTIDPGTGTEVSVATNVPTSNLYPEFEIDTTAGSPADTHLTLDYWWHEFDITR